MEIMQSYPWIFSVMLIFLAILLVLCLIRSVIGPSISDRVVAVNMMGTIVMVIICILALQMGEGYLVDICLIYAMISFLAVVVLTKVYTGVYREKMDHGRKRKALEREEEMQEGGDENGNS
ncbi:MAG: cation:proton antiporter [Blautia sp.]|nr:cation:proton antiporter [Blautia sp.]MDY5030559.1 cation:proton antiporter [Blautia sp.]